MLVAGVVPRCPMLNVTTAATMVATPAEVGVQRLKYLGVDATDLGGAEQGSDVFVDLRQVAASRARLHIENVEPPVKQLVESRGRFRMASLVDLSEEAGERFLG
ncbi:hypothetical protein ABN034_11630 [Actinopolymorpha sp. B11F2]|uniref:hypothetical protein n=1 Tax=Actinopolymorpha sp. B11F2 TaxID=3160862 RepID=UPI0032E3F62F